MPIDQAFFATWTPRAQGLLRLVASFLFLQHATAKFFGIPHVAFFDSLQLMSLIGIAGIIELVGGTLLLIGLWARAAAFVLSGEMAFAYFMGHMFKTPAAPVFIPLLNGGNAAILFCFAYLYLACAGGGVWSADAVMKKR